MYKSADSYNEHVYDKVLKNSLKASKFENNNSKLNVIKLTLYLKLI